MIIKNKLNILVILFLLMFTNSYSNINDDILNRDKNTIIERYNPPIGYKRKKYDEKSFEYFLEHQKLKPYGSKSLYYNGASKSNINVYDSVFDVDIGNRNLHQCADAIILLRAEYFYSNKEFDKINFNFTSGFKASYSKWIQGYRINVTKDNKVTYVKKAEPSNTYKDFRKFMDVVFSYAGTLSLNKELNKIEMMDMKIGDVFIRGGSPGHAVIVVDMAENGNGEKVYMLAQSYMPAQQTQILLNLNDKNISPWYKLTDSDVSTPEWHFTKDQLKRF